MESKSPELVALGQAIRDLRKRSGLSQQDAAAKSGISRTYLGQVENGWRNPTFATLIWIARTLDISMTELVRAFDDERARMPSRDGCDRVPAHLSRTAPCPASQPAAARSPDTTSCVDA